MSEGVKIPVDFSPKLPSLLRELLWARGFRDQVSVDKFLNPTLSDIPSPLGILYDLEIALSRLLQAREAKEEITIFGDYDVDGSTSAVLLVRCLRDWGFRVQLYIPHRVEEGYGLTKKAVEKCLDKFPQTKIVISCDCGVSSFEGVAWLKAHGVEVIVTDHHEPAPERVEAIAVLNPKQKNCIYPDKKLAGVGVAFLLILALRKALGRSDYPLKPLLDLVALGTICDLAELTGVNRILVKHGLQVLESQARPGVRALCEVSSAPKKLRAKDIGFLIGPRINASGRVGLPDKGAHCLLSPDLENARNLARDLDMSNRIRRQIQETQTEEARREARQLLEANPSRASLVLSSPAYHLGIVGLMASRLCETYKRPCAVLTKVDDEHFLADYPGKTGIWKGSLRAPLGFHLAQALQNINLLEPGLLISFGGHALAAGVTLDEQGVARFKELFEYEAIAKPSETVNLLHEADLLASPQELTELMDLMEPFGQGNPSPLLRASEAKLRRIQVMKEEHLKLFIDLNGHHFSVLQFRSPWVSLGREWGEGVSHGRDTVLLDLLVELSENEWNGRRSVELVLREILDAKRNGESHGFKEFQRKDEIGTRSSV